MKAPSKIIKGAFKPFIFYLLVCLYDFIYYMFFLIYFSLRRLAAVRIQALAANPNPANPVLVSVVPVFANLLT